MATTEQLGTEQTIGEEERRRMQQAALARKWIAEIGVSEKAQQKWLTRARKIAKLYKRESTEKAERRFAMLWSNTETIRPAIYSRPPQPVVVRRFKDADPVGRVASEALERALAFSIDAQNLDNVLKLVRDDYTLVGRGQAWIRYCPTYGAEVTPEPVEVVQVTNAEDGKVTYQSKDDPELTFGEEQVSEGEGGLLMAQPEPYQPVAYEEVVVDYLAWDDFGHEPARVWEEVGYVWRKAYMDRAELKRRFGEELGAKIPLDWSPKANARQDKVDESAKKAVIYEVWDKRTKKVLWLSLCWNDGPLDVRDDPLGLSGFFPCPKPLLGSTTNESLIPTPEYAYYQDQAEEIDDLTAKIAQLQDELRVRGLYPGEGKGSIEAALKASNTVLIPVADWLSFKEQGGIRGMIEWWPLDQVVAALKAAIELRRQLIDDVYQITGVADIMRGSTDPSETATAQGIKAQWGSMRVRDRQKEIVRFARDLIALEAEVIAERFGIDTLARMTGVQLPMQADKEAARAQVQMLQQQAALMAMSGQPAPPIPPELEQILSTPSWEEVKALLEDDAMRQFRIDVETDSTIEPDEAEEKAATTELLTALGSFVAQWGPVVQTTPAMAPMVGELLKWAVRRFRAGREIEDVIERTMNQMMAGGARPPPQEQQAAPAEPPGPTQAEVALKQAELAVAERKVAVQAAEVERKRARDEADIALEAEDLRLRQGQQTIDAMAAVRDPNPQVIR